MYGREKEKKVGSDYFFMGFALWFRGIDGGVGPDCRSGKTEDFLGIISREIIKRNREILILKTEYQVVECM